MNSEDTIATPWRRIGTLVGRIMRSALAPPAVPCLVCRRPCRQGAGDVTLCAVCAGKIPWIECPQCLRCGREQCCADCLRIAGQHLPDYLVRNRSAVHYDAEMKAWLGRYKYQGDEQLAVLFGRILHHAWSLLEQSPRRSSGLPDLISYIPLSAERLAERGFNQAEQMARALAAELPCPVSALLDRPRHGARLSSQSRQSRQASMDGAFRVHPSAHATLANLYCKEQRQGALRILLVDDVYTTGSTLYQASATLMRQMPDIPLRIESVTWARA